MEEFGAELEESQNSDNEALVPAAHNKLLGAVSQLYEKKRVKASTRKEPSLEVSEFHLSQPGKVRSSRVKVTDLAKVLNKRAAHVEISQKLKSAQKRAKTLPRPLEKIHSDKITRTAGYEHAKQQLNRWDAIVYKQRVAEQVSFPLKSDTIKVQESTDILSMFRKPTELELKLAELLKEPNPLQQAEKEQESKKEIREEDYPLSLTEVIEKRKIMAKLRAQQSYRQTKAMRHSKIKSKKFHQIQRRARVKEQLKEFEELQKKDPEAALKKLEELERTRAEERVTLRHKSTGQWAKNLAVRARYDKEARIALAEQLSKSKELTVKLAQNRDSESEKEEEEEVQPEPAEDDPNNPWVVKRSKEMEDFVSSYRKYWDTKGKVLEKNLSRDTTVKEDTPQVDSEKIAGQESSSKGNAHANKDSKEQGLEDSVEIRISENSKVNSAKKSKCSLSKNVFTINDTSVSSNEKKRKSNENYKFNILDVDVKKNNVDINRLKATDSYPEKTVKSKTGCWSVTKVNLKDSNVLKNCKKLETNKKTKKLNKLTSKHHHKDAKLAEKMVEKKQKEKTLDELFEGVEDKILAKVETKIKKIKESLNLKKRNQVDSNTESEMEDVPSLEMKKKKISAEVDEKLVELSSKSDGKTTGGLLEKTLVTASSEAKKTDDIDPNKFLKVTPRHLSSRIPEIMTEGEEALDDEEVTTEDRHLTIAEAFAEDDVVDQFQKEKEEEVKKSGVGDVDLSLPGWGSWAGHNMKPVSRRRRKKFIIKFPKAIPRRDINRGNVIINEDADKPLKEHQVSEIPFPFTSVQEYEASVRAPLGTTWVPQTAHRKLTLPPVVTQLGAAIQPMDESQLINKTNKVGKKKKLNRKINKK